MILHSYRLAGLSGQSLANLTHDIDSASDAFRWLTTPEQLGSPLEDAHKKLQAAQEAGERITLEMLLVEGSEERLVDSYEVGILEIKIEDGTLMVMLEGISNEILG